MNTTLTAPALDFVELEAMDAPDDGADWIRGFNIGFALGVIAFVAT